jgi:hypothetical protein
MGGNYMCHKDANSNFMVVKLINFMNNIKVAYIVTNNYAKEKSLTKIKLKIKEQEKELVRKSWEGLGSNLPNIRCKIMLKL